MDRLTDEQIREEIRHLREWELMEGALTKLYKFADFKEAMAFVNRVAELAESMDHHPDILIQYSKVRLTLVTHSARGLTQKDFRLAHGLDAPEGLT